MTEKRMTKLEYEKIQRFANVLPNHIIQNLKDSNAKTVVNITQKIEESQLLDEYSLTNLEVFLNLSLFLAIDAFYFDDERQAAYEYSEQVKQEIENGIIENHRIDRQKIIKHISEILKYTECLFVNGAIRSLYYEVESEMDGKLDDLIQDGYIKRE